MDVVLCLDAPAMRKQPPRPQEARRPKRNFIRAWRKHRGLTLEKLAEKSGLSPSQISNLEGRKNGYTSHSLEALADALECETGDLLSRRPGVDDVMLSLWKKLDDQTRERWLRTIRSFQEPPN